MKRNLSVWVAGIPANTETAHLSNQEASEKGRMKKSDKEVKSRGENKNEVQKTERTNLRKREEKD